MTDEQKKLQELIKENQALKETVEKLNSQLEVEQEWKPTKKIGTHYSQEDYLKLMRCCEKAKETNSPFHSEKEAKEKLSSMFGFDSTRIVLIHEVSRYEINRHNNSRRVETYHRDAMWASHVYNYARFNVMCDFAYTEWEMIDGNLREYKDILWEGSK